MQTHDQLLIKLFGNPDKVSLSDRILNLVLLFGVFAFISATIINSFLTSISLVAVTFVAACFFGLGYYLSNIKGKAQIVSYATVFIFISLYLINWQINQGSYGPTAYYSVHITLVIYFVLKGKLRQFILLSFLISTLALFAYEYLNPAIFSDYQHIAERYIDLGFSNLQGVLFMLALFMYLQWNFTQDIIIRKKMHGDLENARRDAEAANIAKSMFLANMSHEMRTPLNAIIGFSDLMRRQHNLNGDKQDNYLRHICQNGEHLVELINNVLDLSKIEANKIQPILEPFHLRDSIESIVCSAQMQARKKGLRFKIDFDDSLPQVITLDRILLNQIITNLLSNAIKFTAEGNVSISLMKQEDQLHILVSDNGIGISEQKQTIIFDEFEQADTSTTREFGGFGLGLAITKNLVSLLHGHISVHSKLGEGSQFEIFLPLKEGELLLIKEESPLEKTVQFKMLQKILVVEDNKINQLVIVDFLEAMGLKVLIAENGMESLSIIQKEQIDLVFMDIQMPIMGGFEALKTIREEYNLELPIIALTADVFLSQQDKMINAGFNACITKPITQAVLEKILKQYLTH